MAEVHASGGGLRVYKLGPFGPISNNSLFLVDEDTGKAAVFDAVAEHRQTLDAVEAAGAEIAMVLITHGHFDHVDEFAQLRAAVDAPFYMHPDDVEMAAVNPRSKDGFDAGGIDVHLRGGETLPLGNTEISVLHAPGHTPGSLCYYAPPFCAVGDVLFPGGPGHSTSSKNLRTLIGSITRELYALPDDTLLFNGHGDDTTVAASRAEYRVFASREHSADLHGDVQWAQD